MLTDSLTRKILFGAYIFSVIVSLLLCDVKLRSLGFHNKDYSFYMEFTSKLLDKNSTAAYSINPEGANWLFMTGVDGANSLHQSIHFEPIKYVYAIIYKIFQSPYALFVFIALIFFIPLPYLALAMPIKSEADMQYTLSLGILYLLSPSVFFEPAFDLRPYVFLAPFFLLSILSIRFSRPSWEKLLWFNALFMAREEAVILGAVVLLYGLANTYPRTMKFSELAALCVSYSIWVAGTFVYLHWAGYSVSTNRLPAHTLGIYERLLHPSPFLIFIILAGSIVGLAVAWFTWNKLRKNRFFRNVFEFISIGIVFVPLGYQLVSDNERGGLGLYLFSSRYFLHYTAIILLAIVIAGYFKFNIRRKIWLGFMLMGTTVIILVNVLAPNGFLNTYMHFNRTTQLTQTIWSFKEHLDSKNSNLLVDYSTHQAFFNFEHVYAYNRLPSFLVGGKGRYYPKNLPFLRSLVSEEINYVVISRTSLNDIEHLLAEASVQGQVLFENEQFIGLEIIRE